MRRLLACAGSLLVLLAVPAAGSSGTSTWTGASLGSLGGYQSDAIAINDQGQVIGHSLTAAQTHHGFFWEPGRGMTDIGTLGGPDTYPAMLNDRGDVVGWSQVPSGRYDAHAFLWRDGLLTDLGTFGGTNSAALAINAHDQVVGSSETATGELHAFLWQNGAMADLGRSGQLTEATDINSQGQIVGRTLDAGADTVLLWENGVATDIGAELTAMGYSGFFHIQINDAGQVLAVGYLHGVFGQLGSFVWDHGAWTKIGLGGDMTSAMALSNTGSVVGVASTPSGLLHPFLWRAGTTTDLGTLGGVFGSARSVNDQDQVVGVSTTAAGESHAFVWSNGEMTDLGTLGGDSSEADAVNNHGQIVGYSQPSGCTGSCGGILAAIWTPASSPAQNELAPNPGFEGDLSGSWRSHQDRGGTADFTTTSDAHGGSQAAVITAAGDSGALSRYLSGQIPVVAGHTYNFTAFLRAQAVQGEGRIDVTFFDQNGNYIADSSRSSADYGQTVSDTTGWTQVGLSETAPAEAATARLEVRLYGTGTLSADDASFTDNHG